MDTVDTIIIGGGIAGLTAAWRLQQAGQRVVLLEAGDRVGGVIRTTTDAGFTKEWGPNAFLGNAEALLALAHDLQLDGEIIDTPPSAADRFIYWNGALHKVPRGPKSFLSTRLLSWRGKLRLLGEFFVPQKISDDETVADFVARRLGREVVERLIDPLVAGIFAGTPEQLSLPAAFPKMARLEQEHGGIFRGALRTKGKWQARAVRSFRNGMGQLVETLGQRLGDAVMLRTKAINITPSPSIPLPHGGEGKGEGRFVVTTQHDIFTARNIICATPATVTASLLKALAPQIDAPLRAIPYAPIIVAHVAYRHIDWPHHRPGFGFLVPQHTPARCLGALWSSNCFAHRAPDGAHLFTMFYGGMRDPAACDLSDATLHAQIAADVRATMGITAAPVHCTFVRHRAAIPQYTLGHIDRVRQIEQIVATIPGLHVTGNYLTGTSVNDTIAHAMATTNTVCSK